MKYIPLLWALLKANGYVLYSLFSSMLTKHEIWVLETQELRIEDDQNRWHRVVVYVGVVCIPPGVKYSQTPNHAGIKRRAYWKNPKFESPLSFSEKL